MNPKALAFLAFIATAFTVMYGGLQYELALAAARTGITTVEHIR